jgi:hypothetical protein
METALVIAGLSFVVGALVGISIPKIRETLIRSCVYSVPDVIARVHKYLSTYRLYRGYGWSFLVRLLYLVLRTNALYYYKMDQGYDWSAHFINTISIMQTGAMPEASSTYAY